MANKGTFKQYCSFSDIITYVKKLFTRSKTTEDHNVKTDVLSDNAVDEISALIEEIAMKVVRKPDCCKYMFVHLSSDARKVYFYECNDDGNLFFVQQDGKRVYLLPEHFATRTIKTTSKVPNMALYFNPFRTKLTEKLKQKGFKQLEDADFLQLIINISDKFNLNI